MKITIFSLIMALFIGGCSLLGQNHVRSYEAHCQECKLDIKYDIVKDYDNLRLQGL